MKKYLFVILLFIFVNEGISQSASNKIILEYGGVYDKPMPVIVFYTHCFVADTLFFGVSYKINEREFLNMITVLSKNEYCKESDSIFVGYYNLKIYTSDKFINYTTNNKIATRDVFDSILAQIENKELVKRADGIIKGIMDRLR